MNRVLGPRIRSRIHKSSQHLRSFAILGIVLFFGTLPHAHAQPSDRDFEAGDSVVVLLGPLRVREGAGLSFTTKGNQAEGAIGTILDSEPRSADGYRWWNVRWDDAMSGWSADGTTQDAFIGKVRAATAETGEERADDASAPGASADQQAAPAGGSAVNEVEAWRIWPRVVGSFDQFPFTAWNLSHDETKLAVIRFDRAGDWFIRIFAFPSLEALQEIPMQHDAGHVFWSPDGEWLAYCGSRNTRNDFHVVEIATGRQVQLPITDCDYRWISDTEMVILHGIRNPGLEEGEDLEAVVSHLDLETLRITRVEYKEPRATFAARFPVYRLEPLSELTTVSITTLQGEQSPYRFATGTNGNGMYIQSRDGQYTRVFFWRQRIYDQRDMLITSDMRYVIWRNQPDRVVHVVELTVGQTRERAMAVILDPGSISAEDLARVHEGLREDDSRFNYYAAIHRPSTNPLNGQPLTADAGRGGLVGVVRLVQRIGENPLAFWTEMAWELENRQAGDVVYGLIEEQLWAGGRNYLWISDRDNPTGPRPWGWLSD